MNLDMKSGAEAPHSKRRRAVVCGLEPREVPRTRESAAVYRRFGFVFTEKFCKERLASRELHPSLLTLHSSLFTPQPPQTPFGPKISSRQSSSRPARTARSSPVKRRLR